MAQQSLKCILSGTFVFKDFNYLFLERGEGREKERERNSVSVTSYMLWLETKPATQACALTRNQTRDLSLCRTMLNQLNHTGKGCYLALYTKSLPTPELERWREQFNRKVTCPQISISRALRNPIKLIDLKSVTAFRWALSIEIFYLIATKQTEMLSGHGSFDDRGKEGEIGDLEHGVLLGRVFWDSRGE